MREASVVADLARFFPEATPVRIPVQFTRSVSVSTGQGQESGGAESPVNVMQDSVGESTVIEFGTSREVLFACTTPLEFADVVTAAQFRWLAGYRSLGGGGAVPSRGDDCGGALSQSSSELDREIMTSTTQPESPAPDFAALWSSARRLHPVYVELAREFVIDAPVFRRA